MTAPGTAPAGTPPTGTASTPPATWKRFAPWAGATLMLAVLALSFLVLHRELRDFHYRDVVRDVRALPLANRVMAVALTALAYLVLAGYDALGLAYVGRRLPARRVAFGSFVAYALSQTLGFPLVTGGSVRYRFWSAWGLSTTEIAQAVSFAGATFTLGVVTMAGMVFVLEPAGATAILRLPFSLWPVGVLLLSLVAGYVAWSIARREPVRVRGWEFAVPGPRMVATQLLLAALDWTLAGLVLWVLLPAQYAPSFGTVLGAFLLAQFAGLVSHVPGGLGVFETLMVVLLRPYASPGPVLGALVAFRVVYYLLPFTVALAMLAGYEARRHAARFAAAAGATAAAGGRLVPALLPQALSVTTFVGGVILLWSGATPSVRGRVSALDAALPLGVIELSHLAGSIAGAGLLVLAWAIRRRLDAAYGLTIALLSVGIVASLLKGLDYEEAIVLAGMLALLVPCRRAFYRKASLTSEPFTPGWVVAVIVVVGATLWLGWFSYKHVEYSGELWWRFRTHGDAPRALRATVAFLAVLVVFALMRLLRHAEAEPAAPTTTDLERARDIASRSPNTEAYLALLGDKGLLFSGGGAGFLMYGVQGRSWVSLGDPVGPPADQAELAWRFREEADRHGGWTVFYEATPQALPLYVDLGLTLLKLGESARVPLPAFDLGGGSRKSMRRVIKDAEKGGATFEIAPAARVPELMPELRRVSDAWLAGRTTREKGFSLGRFDERYLEQFPMALVRQGAGGPVVAFANVWANDTKEELSVDLMRQTDDAPPAAMQYLFLQLMLWGRAEGYQWFDLGMAPLSGFERHPLASRWNRLGALLFRHGEHFYNFQGLRGYKEKFDPVWEPRYLASPGGLALPRILTNVATLIAGGIGGVVGK